MSSFDPYQNLANAIVEAAAKDYRDALMKLKIKPKSATAAKTKYECEEFFHSDLYSILTRVKAEYLINEINKQVDNEFKKKRKGGYKR